MGRGLKAQLHRELHGAWTALLVLRRDRAKAFVEHLGRLTEGQIGKDGVNISKIGAIEKVKGFGPELERETIDDVEISTGSKIQLELSEPSNEIARSVPGILSRWRGKGSGIDGTAARILLSVNIDWLIWNEIDAAIESISGGGINQALSLQRDGKPCSRDGSQIHSPVLQNGTQ